MSQRIVTIFGASGFLGRHMVRALAKDGWRIRACSRYPHLAEFLRPYGMVGQIQPFKADVTREAEVRRAVAGADAVINLAGVMHGGLKRFTATHDEGAGIVARAVAESGVTRLLHVSTLLDGESKANYAASKRAGEAAVRAAFPDATIFRPSVVFGQEDRFFNRFANMARYVWVLPLIGGGETRFQPAFVSDVADAARAVLNSEHAAGATYELGGPEVLTFRQILEMIARVIGRRRLYAPVPFALAKIGAWPAALLPNPPITPDQVEMLKGDSIVSEGAKGFADLSISPEAPEAIVPGYLWRFRRTGQFEPAPQ